MELNYFGLVVNICDAGYSGIQSKESVWCFYCKPYNFKSSKSRKHRKTKSGGWKINGKGSAMKVKDTKVVIGRKTFLSFYLRSPTSIKGKAEWVMHEILIEDNPLYKGYFVVCRLERRRYNKHSIPTSDDSESSHLVVAEDASLKCVLPPNQHLVSDRNHVAEKTSLLPSHNLQILPNQHLVSDSRNHASEKLSSWLEDQTPSHYLTSGYSNHAAGKTLPTDEFQQLPSHHWTFRGQVAEHSFPVGESILSAQFDALEGSSGLNYNSLPAFQSPIDVGDDGFSGCNVLDHNSF